MPTSTRNRPRARPRTAKGKKKDSGGRRWLNALIVAGIVGLVAAAVFFGRNPGEIAGAETGPGGYAYQVGEPGSGEAAPAIQLPAADGGTFDLAEARGETVLLYFQEGLMCQPCGIS